MENNQIHNFLFIYKSWQLKKNQKHKVYFPSLNFSLFLEL